MDPFANFIVYAMGGYTAAYFVLKPSALAEAIGAGPGISAAGMEWSRKHFRLTMPLTIGGLILAAHLFAQVQAKTAAQTQRPLKEPPQVSLFPVGQSSPLQSP